MIITISILVAALIDRGEPFAGRYDQNLTSFENFKMSVLQNTQKDQAYIPDDATLQKMYESARNERINSVMHQTYRDIVVSSLVTAFALILFVVHLWLMRKLSRVKKIE